MPALLTPGLPRSRDFIDWTSIEQRPPAPPHSDSHPFGYRFRTDDTGSMEMLDSLEYDPDLQIARTKTGHPITPVAKGSRCGGNTYTKTYLDGTVVIDLARDVIYDD